MSHELLVSKGERRRRLVIRVHVVEPVLVTLNLVQCVLVLLVIAQDVGGTVGPAPQDGDLLLLAVGIVRFDVDDDAVVCILLLAVATPYTLPHAIAQLEAECVLDVALLALVEQPLDGRLVEKALHLCTEKQR